jgi:hypothetical protein
MWIGKLGGFSRKVLLDCDERLRNPCFAKLAKNLSGN